MSWQGAARARQRVNLRRIQERMEGQTPKLTPCSMCGKLVPTRNMVTLDRKAICDECYARISREKDQNK